MSVQPGFGLLAALLALAGAARAADKPPQAQQCFLRSNVQSFNAPDGQTVYLRVGVSEIWRLGLMNDCLELPWRESIGLESTGGDPWICRPIDATVISRGVGVPHRCPVVSMHKLTPDEVAALPKKLRP